MSKAREADPSSVGSGLPLSEYNSWYLGLVDGHDSWTSILIR